MLKTLFIKFALFRWFGWRRSFSGEMAGFFLDHTLPSTANRGLEDHLSVSVGTPPVNDSDQRNACDIVSTQEGDVFPFPKCLCVGG